MGDTKRFWGSPDAETLTHESVNEAIEDIIDGCYPDAITPDWMITVVEYKPMEPVVGNCYALEGLLEQLDEEYGDPDGGSTKPTAAMKEAERAFINAVLKEYQPWACWPTGEQVTVNAVEWCQEHCPEWLEDKG